jgi:hypothetical protein
MFKEGTRWKVLVANSEAVPEPENPNFACARAPTVPADEAANVPVKHNFDERFEQPPFTATYETEETFGNGRLKYNRDGSNRKVKKPVERGRVNPTFVKNNNLTVESHPVDFVHGFFPVAGNRHLGKEYISIEQITKWTNLKATLAGAGPGGTTYTDFKPFTVKEIRRHLGLYVFNGLSPSPQLAMKFQPSSVDPVHGNDFIYRSFGPGAERRQRHFRAFFACQNPAIEPPDRKKFPNWKVRPLLVWMNLIFKLAWILARSVSIDEQTIGFQGKHKDKRRITYKRAGDGFQNDALCQDGYTYQFYF